MMELRTLRPEEYPDAVRLANSIFRSDGRQSMGFMYPMAFFPGYGQSVGIFEEGQLVSFIGVVPNVVRIGPAELRTHSIGAVCTYPDHRGKGYAGMILDRILGHLKRTNSPLLLVSGGRSLYTRIGCREFGTFQRFDIDRDNKALIGAASGLTIRNLEPEDWFELRRLSHTRDVRYEQGLWDLATMIHADVPSGNDGLVSRVLVAENEAEGGLCGFLVLACSGDPSAPRDAEALEWAGPADVAAALLAAAVHRTDVTKAVIRVSWHDRGLLELMGAIPSRKEHNQGTAFITEPQLFVSQIRPYLEGANQTVSDRFRIVPAADGRWTLSVDERQETISSGEFSALVFEGECPPSFDSRLQNELSALFPVPFPYTGGINYV